MGNVFLIGNWKNGQDNFNLKYYEVFVDYLMEVVFKYKEWGIQFDILVLFNELCEGWWYIDWNKFQQEGCNFLIKLMDKVFVFSLMVFINVCICFDDQICLLC